MNCFFDKIYLNEVVSNPDSYKGKTLAVHLHTFYLDELRYYADALSYIPIDFDLYLSVPEVVPVAEPEIKGIFLSHARLKNVYFARTPNRGRDISPMLCTFREQLLQYDFLLHLHTKKSLHNECLKEWGQYLLSHLLPDEQSVSRILTLLSDNYFLLTPNDLIKDLHASGWGERQCNLPVAQSIIDRSGLTVNLASEFPTIDYPQGSFFWARVESIKPLLDVKMAYEDFPAEPIPVDGTAAHAIERLFCVWGWVLNNGKEKKLRAGKIVERSEDVVKTYLMSEIRMIERKNERHLKKMRVLIFVVLGLLLLLFIGVLSIIFLIL